ncbi:hypothetical protein BDV98DRAFT_595226 [Pterulicium gracile]|uniref:Uncharacterized protein n=1 Tax=Pterulicium gracile TaxID=1884261 RepID=A0A5C3QB32_9AGAR|nr:hypothetical protein BDV98DRAFT_595226 [Pterula gracilis]
MSASTECTVTPTGTTTITTLETTQQIFPSQLVTTLPGEIRFFTSTECILQDILGCISSGLSTFTIHLPGEVKTIEVPITQQVVQTRLAASILFGTTCSTVPIPGETESSSNIQSESVSASEGAPQPEPTPSNSSSSQDEPSGAVSMTAVVTTPPPITSATTITFADGAVSISYSVTQPPPSTILIPVVQTDTSENESASGLRPVLGGALGAAFGFILIFATFWYLRRRRFLTAALSEKPIKRNRFSLDTDERHSKSFAAAGGAQSFSQPAIQLPSTPAQPSRPLTQHPLSHHLLHHEEQDSAGDHGAGRLSLYSSSEGHSNFNRTQSQTLASSSHSHHFRSQPSSELSHGMSLSPVLTSFYLPPSLDYTHSSSPSHDHSHETHISQSRSGSPTSLSGLNRLPDADAKQWTLRITNATPTPRGREDSSDTFSFLPEEDPNPFADSPHGPPTILPAQAKDHQSNPFSDEHAIPSTDDDQLSSRANNRSALAGSMSSSLQHGKSA